MHSLITLSLAGFGLVLGLALLVWGLRWLWPLQFVPGWLVAGLLAWALLEVAALLLAPRRWR